MRHINGVYTQRHNQLKRTDGSLCSDSCGGGYLRIAVAHYIHRNLIETKKPLVDDLVDYLWSSYPATINKGPAPHWLKPTLIYVLLDKPQRYLAYKKFAELENDDHTTEFYGGKNLKPVLGCDNFLMMSPNTWMCPRQCSIRRKVDCRALIASSAKWQTTLGLV